MRGPENKMREKNGQILLQTLPLSRILSQSDVRAGALLTFPLSSAA